MKRTIIALPAIPLPKVVKPSPLANSVLNPEYLRLNMFNIGYNNSHNGTVYAAQ